MKQIVPNFKEFNTNESVTKEGLFYQFKDKAENLRLTKLSKDKVESLISILTKLKKEL